VVWLRVTVLAERQYLRESLRQVLVDSLGVGVTFIDMDTFNVEGLFACFKQKVTVQDEHLHLEVV
jgi:hypothetical protein